MTGCTLAEHNEGGHANAGSKTSVEAFKAANPKLVADIEYLKLTAPELPSKMLGAGRLTIFARILVPLTVPGILTAGILSLVKAISMFELTYLVAGGKSQTIVVAL